MRRIPSSPMRPIALAALLVLISGCTAITPAPQSPTSARLQVVATIYPLAYLAERIGGDAVNVTLLTPPGSEPHDFEPTPQAVSAAASADLLIINGAGIDAWAQRVDRGTGATLVMQSVITFAPMEDPGDTPETGHDRRSLDPHAWLDPVLLQDMTHAITAQLTTLDPSNAKLFQQNATAFVADLAQLDTDYQSGLSQCQGNTVVVSHDAFGYPARRYHLHLLAVAGISPEEEPSPAQLATIARQAQAAGVTTIFTETLASPRLAETLAQELHLQTAVLNPAEGLTTEEAAHGEDLLSLMHQNLQNLRTALQCE